MASIVLNNLASLISNQPFHTRCHAAQPLNSLVDCRAKPSVGTLRDRCIFGSSCTSQQVSRFQIAMSVSEPVITQTGGGVIEVEDEPSLERYFQEAGDKLVVLDVSTKTCGPCKMVYPKVVKMSKEYPDVIFLKINGDLNNDTRALMRKWGVRAVPNFRFFRNGKLIHSHTGANEDELRSHFMTHYIA